MFRGKDAADMEINFCARCRAEGKDPTEDLAKIMSKYPPGTLPGDVPEFDYSDSEDEEETPKLWHSPEPSDYTDSEPSTPVGRHHQETHHQGNYQPEENESMHDAEPLEDRQHSALHGHMPPEQHRHLEFHGYVSPVQHGQPAFHGHMTPEQQGHPEYYNHGPSAYSDTEL